MNKQKQSLVKFFVIKSLLDDTARDINTFAFDNELVIKDVKKLNKTTLIVIFED